MISTSRALECQTSFIYSGHVHPNGQWWNFDGILIPYEWVHHVQSPDGAISGKEVEVLLSSFVDIESELTKESGVEACIVITDCRPEVIIKNYFLPVAKIVSVKKHTTTTFTFGKKQEEKVA